MPVAPLIGAGLGLAQSVIGLFNSGKAKREAEELARTRPKLKANPDVQSAVDLAESELANGLSAESQTAYEQGTDRDLAGSIDAILKSGSGANNIGDVFDSSVQGRQRLSQLQDNLRLNQINNLVRSQQYNNEEEQKRFEFNDVRPWMDKAQANAQARQGAQNQIWGGINTLGSSAMSYFNQQDQQNNFDNYFKVNNNTAAFSPNPVSFNTARTSSVPSLPPISPNSITQGTGITPVTNYGIPNANAGAPDANWGNFSNDLFAQYR